MQNYNLPAVNFDNTFPGVLFVLPTSELYDLTHAYCKIQLRSNYGLAVIKEFTSPFGLLITLPHTITFPEQSIQIAPGTYKWDLKITFSDGREKTYIGGTWTINPVITR